MVYSFGIRKSFPIFGEKNSRNFEFQKNIFENFEFFEFAISQQPLDQFQYALQIWNQEVISNFLVKKIPKILNFIFFENFEFFGVCYISATIGPISICFIDLESGSH